MPFNGFCNSVGISIGSRGTGGSQCFSTPHQPHIPTRGPLIHSLINQELQPLGD